MNKERKPVYKKGEKNAFCPFYGTCLDEAVKKSWAFWDCSECEHRSSRDPEMDVLQSLKNDSTQIYDLPDGLYDDS